MITNTGKQIIGRYLVGQTTDYASYLAIGCGPKPLATLDSFGNYATKTSLDYEMIRVPIISKTVVNESGIDKIVLTAELPTTERYGITEIGIYPGEKNAIIYGIDSRNLSLFNSSEPWKYHSGASIENVAIQSGTITNNNNDITIADDVFFTTSTNALFDNVMNPDRLTRYEQPRFLDEVLLLKGNSSTLTVNGSDLSISSGSHIHLQSSNINFDSNSTNDELRLAFSVINKNGIGSTDIPSNVKILIQFASSDGASPEYASFVVNLSNGNSAGQWDFTNNRYVVVNKKLSDLYKTTNFSWSDVSYVKVYACVNNGGSGADNFFIALDGLRLENLSSFNSVYGLTAYTVIKSSDELPIIKLDNSLSIIEFKYVLDVL